MKVIRETKVYLETTDGKELAEGKRYVFDVAEKSYVGIYKGINKRGDIRFGNVLAKNSDVIFNFKPSSIISIYEANFVVGN